MSWTVQFVDLFLSGWSLVFLALICGIHYTLTVFRLSETQQDLGNCRLELQELQLELVVAEQFKTIANLENSLLREFVSQSNLRRALQQLLKRYVPDPDRAFAILLECDEDSVNLQQARGLAESSQSKLTIDNFLVELIRCQGSQKLTDKVLRKTEFWNQLSQSDRSKISELFIVGLGEGSRLTGLFITTSLYPIQAPEFQRMELARRLMTSASDRWKELLVYKKTETELRSTSEMLELRSIPDQKFETPFLMMESFLNTLQKKIASEHSILFLAGPDVQENGFGKSTVRAGAAISPGIVRRWKEHEERLAKIGKLYPRVKAYSKAELKELGIDSLMGAAITAPLIQNGAFIGIICMFRTESLDFTPSQLNLVQWSANYLSETILRTLNQACIERQAKRDGLTGLANRRTFDQMIEQEVKRANEAGSECSLIMFDIDHFKAVNDNWGHQVGDDALKMFANVLEEEIQLIRSSDRAMVARYGGEEMAVLLPGIGMAGAMRIGESMRMALEAEVISLPNHELKLTTSAGVSSLPNHATNAAGLIAAADKALYRAKESGRNKVCVSRLPSTRTKKLKQAQTTAES